MCIRWSVTVGSLKSESPKSLGIEILCILQIQRRASGSDGVSIEILHIYKVKQEDMEIRECLSLTIQGQYNLDEQYTVDENIIGASKMRNNCCYSFKIVIFTILRWTILLN